MLRLPVEQIDQADAVHLRRRNPKEIENGRHDVREPDDAADAPGRDGRRADDERDAEHAFVDEHAVSLLAVIAQRLSVVARDDHDRPTHQTTSVQRVEQAADL